MGYNWKNSVKYLIYGVGFIVLLIFLSEMTNYFQNIMQRTYNFYPWTMYSTLIYLPIGIYLGVPKLLKEFKKTGKWKINFQKLIFIGLPALYYAFYLYIPFFRPIPRFLIPLNSIFSLSIIMVGYIIIDSFIKEQENEK
ncbi:hypothetical protein [Chengkuizengella marina]|uniref:Uncharacterized protein n=1 Tax=Chengkuizengella marina TaxID=2507566 RepID=A0A6N9PX30_9BACL|nr:hypothetical protein [Chengkuizengella marina]NBI28061.1 hypothetical protein [Chengkuizengella marina]